MCKNKTETCKCCGHAATLVPTDFDFTLPEERGRFILELLKDTPHAGFVSLQRTAHDLFGDEDLNMEEHDGGWSILAYAMARKVGKLKDLIAKHAVEARQL